MLSLTPTFYDRVAMQFIGNLRSLVPRSLVRDPLGGEFFEDTHRVSWNRPCLESLHPSLVRVDSENGVWTLRTEVNKTFRSPVKERVYNS